jgi:hypothetical protein
MNPLPLSASPTATSHTSLPPRAPGTGLIHRRWEVQPQEGIRRDHCLSEEQLHQAQQAPMRYVADTLVPATVPGIDASARRTGSEPRRSLEDAR